MGFVLEGYNGTVFAYGQTGTGKTFTMEGVRSNPELKGIIPNSFAHIFRNVHQIDSEFHSSGRVEGVKVKKHDFVNQKSHISKNKDFTFLIRVSYLEIYCEEIRDLLGKDQTKRLELKERPDIGVYVKDKKEFAVNSAEDMEKIMTEGNKNRMVASTKMNADSSRYFNIKDIIRSLHCRALWLSGEYLSVHMLNPYLDHMQYLQSPSNQWTQVQMENSVLELAIYIWLIWLVVKDRYVRIYSIIYTV